QSPDQVGVDGAEDEFAAPGALAGALDFVEYPGDLGGRKVRVDEQTGARAQVVLDVLRGEFAAARRRAPVLPDDGIVDRPAAVPLPHQRGLALVGDADGGDVGGVAANGLAAHCQRGGPDFLRVVLDPAVGRVDLAELALGGAPRVSTGVEDDGAGTRGSLVDGQKQRFVHGASESPAGGRCAFGAWVSGRAG